MIYKKQVVQELIYMDDLCMAPFYKRVKKVTFKSNRLIRYHNAKIYSYYCTHCNNWHQDKIVKIGIKKECKHCHQKFDVIGYRNVIKEVGGYLTAIEKNDRNELILRLCYYVHWYEKENQRFRDICYEVLRVNVNRNISVKKDTYYTMGNGYGHAPNSRKWRINQDTYSYYGGKQNFINVVPFSEVVTTGIKKIMKDTDYVYSALDIVAKNNIDIYEYLKKYKDCQRLELLVKSKCFNLLRDLLFNKCSTSFVCGLLDKKEMLKLVIKYNLSSKEIEYANRLDLSDRRLIRIAAKWDIRYIPEQVKKEKFITYLNIQKETLQYYLDYVNMASEAGFPMYKTCQIYPRNLVKEHDKALKAVEIVRDAKISQEIEEYSRDLAKYEWKSKRLCIRPARTQEELIAESEKLKHCVRRYAKNMSKRETAIFFIRDVEKIEEPYVTLELKNEKVVQVRGFDNNSSKPLEKSVVNFVKNWEQRFQLTGY